MAREFLGKRLTSKLKKDLPEISQKTNKSVRTCRRQLENFRRVYRRVCDLDGDPWSLIHQYFCISPGLTDAYATVIFYSTNRIETKKRRLASYSYAEFESVGKVCLLKYVL